MRRKTKLKDHELSWWLQEAHRQEKIEPHRLSGTVRADVCIVGGGFTGLWTAIHLKQQEPGLDVALLEARTCGSGASGRNGGMMLSWWAKLPTLAKLFGDEEALRLAKASADAIEDVGRFCDDHGIDAHFRHEGWLWAATNETQIGAWNEAIAKAESLGQHPFTRLTRAQAQKQGGSAAHVGGVFERSAATVQPALLALGLRRVAIELGVTVYEQSPMVDWAAGSAPLVETERGEVRCDKIIFATNAWMVRERQIARSLVVVTSDMVVTRPVPELLSSEGPVPGLGVSDSRMLVNYYRTTRDHRLAFGHGGGSFAFGRSVGRSADHPCWRTTDVTAAMTRLYPSYNAGHVEASWTGPIDRSISSLPFFGSLDKAGRALYGTGYSGNGVGPSYLGGKILASMVLGTDDEWTRSRMSRGPVGTYPPEPLKYVGGYALRAVLRRKEALEDRDKQPGPIIRTASLLAPPGLVPVRRNNKAQPFDANSPGRKDSDV
ncbi:FAD-dependent oxidoreductase [uncultured Aeromicrobium sp.]|uniref:FAD-dependent oxidoreductase n=1 Tax=uncultured Aeromicrobium sp. TaxID=337820 RepID=UPI0025F11D5E|nr:FAD-dependent oxidoreductase [uncultured Aeromicrobium sp.]